MFKGLFAQHVSPLSQSPLFAPVLRSHRWQRLAWLVRARLGKAAESKSFPRRT